MLGNVAIANIIESYKARFKPDKSGQGYRYYSNGYGDGIALSSEQYAAYITEFETFVNRAQRFMVRWAIGMVFVLIVAMVATVVLLDIDALSSDQWGFIGGGLFVLPLFYFFHKGYELQKKPLRELVNENPGGAAVVGVQRKRSFAERFDQNLMGVSPLAIATGIGAGLLGTAASAYEFANESQYKLLYLLFPASIVMFAAIGWRRKKIVAAEAALLHDQTQFKIDRAENAWLSLNETVVHSCAKSDIQNSVLSVTIPLAGTDAYRSADPYEYFHQISTAFNRDLSGPNEGIFLLSMDWKEAVEDYVWKLNSAVAGHPEIASALSLPDPNRYPSNASILYEGVLADVVAALNEAGLSQVFVNDQSDTFHAFVIKTIDTDEVADFLTDLHLEFRFDFP